MEKFKALILVLRCTSTVKSKKMIAAPAAVAEQKDSYKLKTPPPEEETLIIHHGKYPCYSNKGYGVN